METTKTSFFSKLPKPIKIILILISIVTLVWWIGFCFYWSLEIIRRFLALISDKKSWWLFIVCVIASVIICLCFAQFYFKLNPFEKFYEWFMSNFKNIRESIANLIGGK